MGKYPTRGKSIGEQFGIKVFGPDPKRQHAFMKPSGMWKAAHHYDSFARIPLGAETGQHLMAKDIKSELVRDWGESDILDEPAGPSADERFYALQLLVRAACIYHRVQGRQRIEYLVRLVNESAQSEHPQMKQWWEQAGGAPYTDAEARALMRQRYPAELGVPNGFLDIAKFRDLWQGPAQWALPDEED